MKQLFLIISLAILIAGCGQSRTEIAKQKYDKALALADSGKNKEALIVLDTIVANYSKEIEYYTKAKDLLRTITISEQTKNLSFLDSILQEKEELLKTLKKNFIESDEYGSETILIHKRQRPRNSYGRTFIKAHLNLKGDFYISSRYTGEEWINHNQIKVYHNGKSVTSSEIKEDGFNNRHFEDGGTKWETVLYKDGADNGIIDFIANNYKSPLKVQFIGKKYYYIVMEKFDKEAIRDGYEISFILKEVENLKQEKANVQKTLDRLK